jgi:putative hydrolase of the HAD superfamily
LIKNIIFDLGGVLYRIDYSLTFEILGPLLGYDLRVGKWPDWFKDLVYLYETGKISTERFLLSLQQKSTKSITPHGNSIVKAWNAMLIGWQDGVFEMFESLNQSYRLFILSNISPLHVHHLDRSLKDKGGIPGLKKWFEGVYFSNEIHCRKPDRKCFEFIINKHNLLAGETLFIDDYPKNILEAEQIGVICVVHNVKENIKNQINYYLDIVC